MQDIRDTVEERANVFIQQEQEKPIQFASLPVYNQTYSYAKEHNECDLCMKSHNEDVACSNAIETAINKNYSGNSLDTDKAIQEVLPRFGMERLNFVLANMVRNLAWDGRISAQNREWVKTVPAPVDEERSRKFVAFSVHPGLLNLLRTALERWSQNASRNRRKPGPPFWHSCTSPNSRLNLHL